MGETTPLVPLTGDIAVRRGLLPRKRRGFHQFFIHLSAAFSNCCPFHSYTDVLTSSFQRPSITLGFPNPRERKRKKCPPICAISCSVDPSKESTSSQPPTLAPVPEATIISARPSPFTSRTSRCETVPSTLTPNRTPPLRRMEAATRNAFPSLGHHA